MNAGLPLIDHTENSHPALPIFLTLLEKQDRHSIVMFTCWSIVTNWIHFTSSFSPSFFHTVPLLSGTQNVETELSLGFLVKYFGADLFLWAFKNTGSILNALLSKPKTLLLNESWYSLTCSIAVILCSNCCFKETTSLVIKSQAGNSSRTALVDGYNESLWVPSLETLKDSTFALKDSETGEDLFYDK